MTVVPGDYAAVDNVSTMAKWNAKVLADDGWLSASNIPAGTGRCTTLKDIEGWYTAYGHTPPVFVGDQFTFTGNVDSDEGASAKGLIATVRCSQIDIVIPIEDEWPYIRYTVHFGNDGTSITLGNAAATDASNPACYTATSSKVEYNDGGWTEECDTSRIMIRLLSRLRRYASSKTGGFYQRKRGRIDALLRYDVYQGDSSSFKAVNSDYAMRVAVNSTPNYWTFTRMRKRNIEDWGPDHEGVKPVGATLVWMWDAINDGTGVGSIVDPASATKWPLA